MDLTELFLVFAGLIAGFIDSIAGGGGLITVPIFSIILGPGSTAIGTNKIVGTLASAAALFVYFRGGHVSFKGNRRFALIVAAGAGIGAILSPLVPPPVYKWLIVGVVPIILWIVWKKDLWVRHQIEQGSERPATNMTAFLGAGLACGLYDGLAGPGGGTLMFLSLMLVARLPLLPAMATAKVANLASASVSLATYAATGHVVWIKGISMGIGIVVGAMIGASFAPKRAGEMARAALIVVAIALAIRLVFS